MKKTFYIASFVFLGILLQFLMHGALEVWYLRLLIHDFEAYGLGLSWDAWFWIHRVGSITLLALGILFGAWQGRYWWPRLYDAKGNVRKARWK